MLTPKLSERECIHYWSAQPANASSSSLSRCSLPFSKPVRHPLRDWAPAPPPCVSEPLPHSFHFIPSASLQAEKDMHLKRLCRRIHQDRPRGSIWYLVSRCLQQYLQRVVERRIPASNSLSSVQEARVPLPFWIPPGTVTADWMLLCLAQQDQCLSHWRAESKPSRNLLALESPFPFPSLKRQAPEPRSVRSVVWC